MNSSKLLQQVISVILVTVFLVGCGAPTATPTLPPPPPTLPPPTSAPPTISTGGSLFKLVKEVQVTPSGNYQNADFVRIGYVPGSDLGPPYPRLGILSWYTPRDFARRLSELTGGQVTITDTHHTALLDFLSARQLVDVVGTAYLGDLAAADRDRLAQAKAAAGFLLLGTWGSSGVEPDWATFNNTGLNSPWPFVPEWFVQEVVSPLPQAVTAGGTILPITDREQDAYCHLRNTGYDNDQVIILDGDRSEAIALKCSTFDRRSTAIHLTTLPELRAPYDFGVFKYDHPAGTPTRLNLWHSWGNWWGYNMTDVGPTYLGLRWNNHRPRIIYQQFKQVRDSQGNLLFDGVNIDTFNQEWFGPYNSNPVVVQRLDLDADGVADYDQQGDAQHNPAGCYPDYFTGQPNWDNCAWATGHTTFARNLRTRFDSDPELASGHNILVQHEFGENAAYLNGQSFENLPSLELSPDIHANRWQTAYDHYAYWQRQGRPPNINFIWGAGKPTDYAQMRLSLAFTLLGNGYFAYVTPSSGNDLLWYDEYAVDSQGRAIDVYTADPYYPPPDTFPAPPSVNIRTDLLEQGQFAATVRPGLGYLGYPVTDAYTITAGVYRRDFERGIVLANFSPITVTLSLERQYRKIQGIQDPQTNDGSLVTGVTLPARDGLILLDPADFTTSPTLPAIVLADRPGGLELISAPIALTLTVGHVSYLPVEVQGYHRPITVTAQTLIHTYVNDVTPLEPGDAIPFEAGILGASSNEIKLQTLRMRPHNLTLTFTAAGQAVSTTLALSPTIQPHTPLFGIVPSPSIIFGFPLPFIQVWGPDCRGCPWTPGDPPGSTRDIRCAKQLENECKCHRIQQILDTEEESRVRKEMPQTQVYATQFLRSIGGWTDAQYAPNEYDWNALDWLFYTLTPAERDVSPLASGVMAGGGWIMCPEYTNPDGSLGFYDPDNTFLVEQYVANIVARTTRYAPDLRFVETANEPASEWLLCPCSLQLYGVPAPECDATSGPNQPACLLGPNSPEFVATYGDLLFTAADEAAEAMAAANPDALLITGSIEVPEFLRPYVGGLVLTTKYMIRRGLLNHDNVAIGVHQYPYPFPGWLEDPPSSCAYYQIPGCDLCLPEGCETAPPFEDYVNKHGDTVWARDLWRSFDEAVDLSLLLHDAEDLGVLDRTYFFDTEAHAGWHDFDPTTTLAREAMAGLRLSALNSHQRMLGTDFSAAPSESGSAAPSYNLMVKYLAGVTPVYRWDAPLLDADYSSLVYKLFTRDVPGNTRGEDIIAFWSNAETAQALALSIVTSPIHFKQVTLTRVADAGGPLEVTTTDLSAPPAAIRVEPLREFYFLSVISDRSGFGWLNDIVALPTSRVFLPVVLRK